MAQGFAREYGADVLVAESAGLDPAMAVAPLTHKVMLEKNIDIGNAFPKTIEQVKNGFDVIVNMSGRELPFQTTASVENWNVPDPIGQPEEVYRAVRDEIERRVRRLIAYLRGRRRPNLAEKNPAAQVDSRNRTPGQ
jgi:arsenate reductase